MTHSLGLSLGAQTSYAELLDLAGAVYGSRFATLRGSFHERQIKGRPYIYFNFRDTDGRVRSAYVGPKSDRVERLIAEFEHSRAADGAEAVVRRSLASIALGCYGIPNRHFRIIHRLLSYGIFRRQGVLIGSHAFTATGNMLGVRWASHGQPSFNAASLGIAVAVPADFGIDADDSITSLEKGMLPLREFSGSTADQRSKNVDSGLMLKIISPGARQEKPVSIPGLVCQLQPTPFTGFILENTVQAAVLAKSGACLVNLPDPSRFAIHCLLERGSGHPADGADPGEKLTQAAALIDWHINERRVDSLRQAWHKAVAGGPEWRHCAEAGRDALSQRSAGLAAVLR